MLKKSARLTKAQFDQVFSIGKRFHTPHFQIIYTRSSNFHGSVVVGKKVYKNAVDRNRLRRQLYAALYRFTQPHQLSLTYIVVAKPGLAKVPQRERALLLTEALSTLSSAP